MLYPNHFCPVMILSNFFSRIRIKKYFHLIIMGYSFCMGQQLNFNKLNDEIYNYNSFGKQTTSQKKLLEILEGNLNDKEKVLINILLAKTFRSANDYVTSIKYLETAEELATKFDKSDSLIMKIYAETAFVFFDSNQYEKSNEIMKLLAKKKYANLDQISVAYLMIQQGYVSYLNKKYKDAEKYYDSSELLLKNVSHCDLPIVFVKKMQLFSDLNDLRKVRNFYYKVMRVSDSCNILKYKIHASTEMKKIFMKHKKINETFYYTTILDSLKNLESKEKKISQMYAAEEKFIERSYKKKEKLNQYWLLLLVSISAIFFLVGIVLSKFSHKFKKESDGYKNQLISVNKELKLHMKNISNNDVKKFDIYASPDLNNKQKEMLNYVVQGYTNKEIAEKMSLSVPTIKYHLKAIYTILDIKNRTDLLGKFYKE
jgi:DNA-binding CsgD family transcriptional regulator